MDTTSSKPLLDALRAHRLLEPEQLKQLDGTAPGGGKSLAGDLIQRGWLTPNQDVRDCSRIVMLWRLLNAVE